MRDRGVGNGSGNVRDFRSRGRSGPNPGGSPAGGGTPAARGSWNPGCVVLVFLGFLLLTLGSTLLGMAVDWQWFTSLGFQSVYSTVLTARVAVFAGAAVLTLVFTWINWLIARRIAVPGPVFPGQQVQVPPGLLRTGALLAALVLAFILGVAASEEWSTILRFGQQTAFGQTDPIFNQDIGFY